MYNIIPFTILIIVSLLLTYKLLKNDIGTSTHRNKKKKMSIFVIALTIDFIAFTLPSSIVGGYFLNDLVSSYIGHTILNACDSLTFSYHSFNILILYIFNKEFKKEIKKMYKSNAENTTVQELNAYFKNHKSDVNKQSRNHKKQDSTRF